MRALTLAAIVFSAFFRTSPALAVDEWKEWKNDTYGIRMLVPEKMLLAGKAFDQGWGGLFGLVGDVELFVIGKLDTTPTLQEMQGFGIVVSGIPARFWKKIHEGTGQNGWKWHKTYRADGPKRALFAILAQNRKASVIIFLRTSHATFRRNLDAYVKWYRSITAI